MIIFSKVTAFPCLARFKVALIGHASSRERLLLPKDSIALTLHIVQTNIMTVGDDGQDFLFERGEAAHHTATEESEKGGYA